MLNWDPTDTVCVLKNRILPLACSACLELTPWVSTAFTEWGPQPSQDWLLSRLQQQAWGSQAPHASDWGFALPLGFSSSLEGSPDLREALSYQLEFCNKGDKSRPAKWRNTERQVWKGHSLEDSLSSGHICLLAHSCVSPAREFCASGPVVFVRVYHGGVIDQIAIRMTKLDLQPPSPEAIRQLSRGSKPLPPNHVVDFLVQLAPIPNDLFA